MRLSTLFASVVVVLSGLAFLPAQSPQRLSSSKEIHALCAQLNQIQRIPYEYEHVDDRVYNEIMARGQLIIPCLIKQITNKEKMQDPRQEPAAPDFRVGDLAFFLLFDITKLKDDQFLPKEVVDRMDGDEGIYPYFEWVHARSNRMKLRRSWEAWLKKEKVEGRWPRQR